MSFSVSDSSIENAIIAVNNRTKYYTGQPTGVATPEPDELSHIITLAFMAGSACREDETEEAFKYHSANLSEYLERRKDAS